MAVSEFQVNFFCIEVTLYSLYTEYRPRFWEIQVLTCLNREIFLLDKQFKVSKIPFCIVEQSKLIDYSTLDYCPRERFLDPSPTPRSLSILYMISTKLLLFIFYYFRVRLGWDNFMGRALRLGQARGPSVAARTG